MKHQMEILRPAVETIHGLIIFSSISGYGFINFDSDQTAIIAMHRMGGKV